MSTEKEYRIAMRILYVSIAMEVLSIDLLCWIGYDYLTGNAKLHNVASVIINLTLFTVLILRNIKKVNNYEHNY